MKLLSAVLWFTVFVVIFPTPSSAGRIKENSWIGNECPTVKKYTGNWCLFENPVPTPANRILRIIKSWDVTCSSEVIPSEKCQIKKLLKRYHPLSLEVMREVYGWLYKDGNTDNIPDDWREVIHGLSSEYYNVIHDHIDRRAIAQAQSFAGIKFHDLAITAARAADKFKTSDDVSDLNIAYEFRSYKGRYSGGLRNGKPEGIGLFVTEGNNKSVFKGQWCNGLPFGPVVLLEAHFGMAFYGKFTGLMGDDGNFIWSTGSAGVDPRGPYFGAFVGYGEKYSKKLTLNWWNRKVTKAELKNIPSSKRGDALKALLRCNAQ